jgi:hypothetical protein
MGRRAEPSRSSPAVWLLSLSILLIAACQVFQFFDRVTDRYDTWRMQSNRAEYRARFKALLDGRSMPNIPASDPELHRIMRRHNDLAERHPDWPVPKYDLPD